jgi:hypothetical protein
MLPFFKIRNHTNKYKAMKYNFFKDYFVELYNPHAYAQSDILASLKF